MVDRLAGEAEAYQGESDLSYHILMSVRVIHLLIDLVIDLNSLRKYCTTGPKAAHSDFELRIVPDQAWIPL